MPKRNRISYAQRALPFAGQGTRMIQEPLRREWTAVTVVGSVLLVLSVLYGFAVVNSIAQVSMRETALSEVRHLTTVRAALERDYLAVSSGITEEYARSLGYRDPEDRVFIQRATTLSYAPDAR